jgi:hypothetical protein
MQMDLLRTHCHHVQAQRHSIHIAGNDCLGSRRVRSVEIEGLEWIGTVTSGRENERVTADSTPHARISPQEDRGCLSARQSIGD